MHGNRSDGAVTAPRRERPALIIVEAVDGVAGEFTPHSLATLSDDANALVAEMIADDITLIRAWLLRPAMPLGVTPAIDALGRIAAAVSAREPRARPRERRSTKRTIRGTFTEQLIEVWRLYASGHEDSARRLLALACSDRTEGLSTEQADNVVLHLLDRLAPVTDDAEAWAALPDGLVIYRAGDTSDRRWSLEREAAERRAERHGLSPRLQMATVAKADVLAFITRPGEAEIVPRLGRAWLLPVPTEHTPEEIAAMEALVAVLLGEEDYPLA